MVVSIKNEETERLARELAKRMGVSISHVRKESAVRREFATSCWQSAGRCAALPDLDTRSPEEILGYDEIGLPR